MGACRSGVFKGPERVPDSRSEIITEPIHMPENEVRTKVIDLVKTCEDSDIPLQDMEVVVSGGRGMKDGENFKVLKELTGVLGGTVGCPRVVVDSGWILQSKQIGQAGTTVIPKTYLVCVISDTVQHVVGMNGSGTIMTINKDDMVSISEVADHDIVGDVSEIVPALVKELKAGQRG